MKVNERLKKLRENLHLSQEFVANHIRMSRSSFSKMENGSRDIKAEELEKLSEVYGVSVDYLLKGDNELKTSEYFARSFEKLSEDDQDEIINAIKFKLRLRKKLDSKKDTR